ncbi:MAG TPA: universal stress protein [Longimicrobiales bacterium]|nr:universal stress protein [Longimicrobiales bacterium]
MSVPRIERILAGVDLPSEDGPDPVLATAVQLAKTLTARLHLVHAVEAGPLEPPLLPSLSRQMEQARAAVDAYLDAALPPHTPVASTAVELGRAHRVLAERAEKVEADLLVLGPHRGFGSEVLGLGRTADRILRTVDVPCWVVRAPLRLPLKRVTAAADFSPVSDRALEMALFLARKLGTDTGAHGAPPPMVDVLHVEWPATLEEDPELRERELIPRVERKVSEALERTGIREGIATRAAVEGAVDPSRGILVHARESGAELVVLGTHGRGALSRVLLGSVASVVASRAPCPVLLVPPEDEFPLI